MKTGVRVGDYMCRLYCVQWALCCCLTVLAVSDRCSRGEAQDTSGPNLKQLLSQAKR